MSKRRSPDWISNALNQPSRPKRWETPRAGDLVSKVLRDLGMPSRRISDRLQRAWIACAEPIWVERTILRRIEGGVLEVGVTSAPLREELAHFHQERLLGVLQTALPDVPLIGLHFVLASPSHASDDGKDS